MSQYVDRVPLLPPKIADLLSDIEAERWARECGWIPGSGYCNNRDCAASCPFHPQLAADRTRVKQARRSRRQTKRSVSVRCVRYLLMLLSLANLIVPA